ncbi:MAG: acyl-CoA thioesterase-2 [Myxococcota bacterium]
MRDVLTELIEILRLERIEKNLFRGQSQDLGWGRVFGGQVLGQALSAAEQTVPSDRFVHSIHGYFLRPGAADTPIVYTVDPIRDGRSFTTRRVVAVQDGAPIFSLSASFQIREDGFDHQQPMPASTGPNGLHSEQELSRRYLDRLPQAILEKIPPMMRSRAISDRPIEIRPIDPLDPLDPPQRPPRRQVWFRTSGKLPEAPLSLHQHLLAYASDFSFLGTALLPHRASWLRPGLQIASLDHAMWFHRPFRMDDWLLYDIESPSASNARGLVTGRFYNRQGELVASTAQEGLIRDRR